MGKQEDNDELWTEQVKNKIKKLIHQE